MNSKLILRILTVCLSLGILGAYVVYAHRRAQTVVTAEVSDLAQKDPANAAPAAEEPAENTTAPTFRRTSLNLVRDEPESAPEATGLLLHRGSQSVVLREDGTGPARRVIENGAPALAPGSKVRTNVLPSPTITVLQPAEAGEEAIEVLPAPASSASTAATQDAASIPPPNPPAPAAVLLPASEKKIIFSTKSAPIFVAPRTAPAPIDPSEMSGLPDVTPPTPPTSPSVPNPVQAPANVIGTPQAAPMPKPRFLAPGSKSIDLLSLEKAAAAPGSKEPARIQQSVTQASAAPAQPPKAP